MSEFTINLRSDNPALLVEFNLPPGTHARIGAALNAEVSIPLAGLAEYAGLIGRTPEGRLYLADPDGENERFIALPAAFPLPPYHFVVFHPEKPAATVVLAVAPARRKIPTPRQILAASAAAVLTVSALIIFNRPNKPATAQPPASQANTPVAPQSQTEKPAPAPTAPAPAAPGVVEMKAAAPETPLLPPKFDLEALAQRIAPAVFRLEVKDANGKLAGTGTAFAISADGLAVTNFHVVEGGESFIARTTQGAEFTVSGVTATDPASDLALITIKASNLPFLELGDSVSMKIGAPVAVFGAPEGLTGSLSDGILSAKRTEAEFEGMDMPNRGQLLQITAPISHGSSGSPVVDQSGKVIAVAAANIPGNRAQSLNLGIPVEAVKKLQKDAASGLADLRQTIKEIKKPKAKDKGNPEAVFFADPDFPALESYFKSRDWIQCIKIARLMATRHPDAGYAQFYLGVGLHGIGLNEQSEVTFKRGLAIAPENGDLWRCLGVVQNAQKNVMDARESWKRAVGISPESAQTWKCLAMSYIFEFEFLEAVQPLENLRKLDRAAFESLIADCRATPIRALAGRSEGLRALLYHFDNLQEEANAQAAEAATPEDLAKVLVSAFLKRGEEDDADSEVADYAPTVEPYFEEAKQTRQEIAKGVAIYRTRWPKRRNQLLGIETVNRIDGDSLEATYRLRFHVSNGRKSQRGVVIQFVRYEFAGGRWLVVGVKNMRRVLD